MGNELEKLKELISEFRDCVEVVASQANELCESFEESAEGFSSEKLFKNSVKNSKEWMDCFSNPKWDAGQDEAILPSGKYHYTAGDTTETYQPFFKTFEQQYWEMKKKQLADYEKTNGSLS